MTPPFFVFVTARFERDYRRLLKGHADLAADYETVLSILHADPYNRSRSHPIKKLEQVDAGDGAIPHPQRPLSVQIRRRRDVRLLEVLRTPS